MRLVYVCLSVSPSVREHISRNVGPIFKKFLCLDPCGRGSVLLWRRCDMLRTSGFMDDVTLAAVGRMAMREKLALNLLPLVAL